MKSIKEFLKKISFIRNTYSYFLTKKIEHKKKKELRVSGNETLTTLQTQLTKADISFFFDMGTLLGIVREGRLLKHDMDIDVGVFATDDDQKKEITRTLNSLGCREVYRYSIDTIGIVEQSFILNDIKFDINYYHRADAVDICYLFYRDPKKRYAEECVMDVVQLSCPHINKIVKIDFAGTSVNIPDSAETYLANRYGSNWRIPDKKYVYWKGPSARKTDLIGYVEIKQ